MSADNLIEVLRVLGACESNPIPVAPALLTETVSELERLRTENADLIRLAGQVRLFFETRCPDAVAEWDLICADDARWTREMLELDRSVTDPETPEAQA